MDWIEDILTGPLYALGRFLWNAIMDWTQELLTKTPAEFSPGAWSFVVDTLYPWTLGIGLLSLNLFLFIGLFRQVSNLKQNLTLEIMVEIAIRIILTNGLMTSGLLIIQTVFEISAAMIADISSFGSFSFRVTDQEVDIGMVLFLWVIGLIYLIISVVCALMIFMAVYGRFLQLYLLVAVAPIATATVIGGQGINHTAISWFKTFLAKTFEIVIIALVLVIAAKMSSSITFGDAEDGFGDWWDGLVLALQSMIQMVILTASVKGVDGFMRRAFGL